MKLLFAIALGGAAGALLRYGVSGLVQRAMPSAFPWGTLTVNVIGSLLLGFIWYGFERFPPAAPIRGFVVVGLLGAFTTFSTYSLETITMARMHDARLAIGYVLVSNVVCIAAAVAGFFAAIALFPKT